MESLYRKYRPLTFESVVGQQHIVSTLEHAVTERRLSHAYLFCGPRGTGKTTMARILAKALLCQQAQGDAGCIPDGTCPECEAIAEGTHPDVYELDAASRTGVDNVREEIINSVSFAPVRGAYKVYIIDEVHMLSPAAFNALLKTLEEPPAHVVFILCTTDPQKILETILSRCQRFDFHRISNEDIEGRLRYVCEQEGFAFDEEALQIVARHARGGMRDALSTLEQLSVFGDGAVRTADAQSLLGEASSTVLAEFTQAIAERDAAALFGLVRTQVEGGNDLLELTRDLVAHMRDVYTARVAGGSAELFDCTAEEVQELVVESGRFEDADRVARVLTVLDGAAIEMRSASDPRLVLEIALTRLSRPKADLTLEALAERVAALEAQIAAGVPSAPMASAPVAPAQAAAPAGRAVPAQAVRPVPASERPAAPAASAASERADLPWNTGSAPAAAPAAARPAAEAAPVRQPAVVSQPQPAAQPVAVSEPQAAPAQKAAAPVQTAAAPASPAAPKQVSSQASAHPRPTAVEVAASAAPATPAVSDASELQRRWEEVVKRVTAQKASRGGLLLHARAKADDGSRLTVELPAGSGFALKMLERPDSREAVVPVVCAVFGSRTVEYVMAGAAATAKAPAPAAEAPATPVAASASAAAPEPASAPAAPQSPATPSAPAPTPAPEQPSPSASMAPAASAAPAPPRPWDSAPVSPKQEAPARSVPAATSAAPAAQAPQHDAPRPWDDDQVPYDDAAIASYIEEEPPFDVPAPAAGPAPTSAPAQAAQPSGGAAGPLASGPASAPATVGSAASAGNPFAHPGVEVKVPQTTEEAKEMLGNIFGEGVVFKVEPSDQG